MTTLTQTLTLTVINYDAGERHCFPKWKLDCRQSSLPTWAYWINWGMTGELS